MGPNLSLQHEGKKYMWDGCGYGSREEAESAARTYQEDNFETHLAEQEGRFFVYTRRVVK